MAYQRCSTTSAPEERRNPAHEHLLKDKVQQPDDDADEQRQDDDANGQLSNLSDVRPRHLLQLRDDLMVELDESAEEILGRYLGGSHGYFVSLWTTCLLQRGQYFFHSTRSGCRRLFFVEK